MEWWHIYLFTRIDNLNVVITTLMIVSFVLLAGCAVLSFVYEGCATSTEEDKEVRKKCSKNIKYFAILAIFMGLASAMFPTQKEVAAIYLIPKVANSNFAAEAAKLPEGVLKLMNLKLDSWVTDMAEQKTKEKK